ncbi:MAG: hypothetical protein D6743_00070 [Calditrichaeota bacterium]|nr:MAG: hypothetical protein D6743_00070 [Calditrichota bacterium]
MTRVSENLKFLLNITGGTLILLSVVLGVVGYFGTPELVWGIFFGYLVALANILFAFFSIKWAFRKSNKAFFAVVVGGMGVRFVVFVLALFFVWKFTHMPFVGFVGSMVGFYLTLQVFEIKFIQRELNNRKATAVA